MTTAPHPALLDLSALGAAFGAPRWVQGPGGNVSVKSDALLWVKASGKRLQEIHHPDAHSGVVLEDARRALAGDADAERRVFATAPRPSLETYFHALGPRVVAHTHPVAVLLVACSSESPSELGLTVVPYERPGKGLAVAVARALAAEPTVRTILLESHGLLVYADTTDEAIATSIAIDERCRARFGAPQPSFEALLDCYLAAAPQEVPGGFVRALPPRAHSDRYLFPDAVVYASVVRVTALEPLPAAVAALGRPVVAVDEQNRRVCFAKNRDALLSCTEVLAAHDWVEDVLTARGHARYLDSDEPARILDLPAEKYRLRQP